MGNKTAREVANAFIQGKRMTKGNYFTNRGQFFLFNNLIAEKETGGFYIQDCGYCTSTTANALNALPGVHLRRMKGEWIMNEKRKWDGSRILIEYNN